MISWWHGWTIISLCRVSQRRGPNRIPSLRIYPSASPTISDVSARSIFFGRLQSLVPARSTTPSLHWVKGKGLLVRRSPTFLRNMSQFTARSVNCDRIHRTCCEFVLTFVLNSFVLTLLAVWVPHRARSHGRGEAIRFQINVSWLRKLDHNVYRVHLRSQRDFDCLHLGFPWLSKAQSLALSFLFSALSR